MMMKHKLKKCMALLLMAVVLAQGSAFAVEPSAAETVQETAQAEIQPRRGAFLWSGNCTIVPYSGQVKVYGTTTCYDVVDDIGITLILYRVNGMIWTEVWRDTFSTPNSDYFESPAVYVDVEPGKYVLQAKHTAWDNELKEENYSEAGPVTVY